MGRSTRRFSGVIGRHANHGFIMVATDECDRRAKRLAVAEKELQVYQKSKSARRLPEGRMTEGRRTARALLNALQRVYGNLKREKRSE